MKHKILGYTFIFAILAAAVSILYYVEVDREVSGLSPLPDTEEVQQEDTLRTYHNSEHDFALVYDKNYILDESGAAANFFRNPGETLVSIAVPKSVYPDTNFGSAILAVAVQEESSEGPCERASSTKTINGTVFYKSETDGAAAGTAYKTELYRVFQNESCFEVSLTVGTANIANFEPGAVTEINETHVWHRLHSVLETFKFVSEDEVVDGGRVYESAKYGFRLTLPEDWKVEEADPSDSIRLTFVSDKTRELFASPDFKEGLSGDMFFANKSYISAAMPNTSNTQVINGKSFTVYLGGPTAYEGLNYEIKNGNRVYVFSAGYVADLESILKTLEFIE
jgi:hypothetical protein